MKNKIDESQIIETIDCTPTWEAAAQMYLMVLENGNNEGKKIAREELLRMAKLADLYVQSQQQNKLINS